MWGLTLVSLLWKSGLHCHYWLCDADIIVLPTCLVLMVWGPGTETLAMVLRAPLRRECCLRSVLLLTLRSQPCLGGTAVLPLSWAWDIWPLSMVMLSCDTEAHYLQAQVKGGVSLAFSQKSNA